MRSPSTATSARLSLLVLAVLLSLLSSVPQPVPAADAAATVPRPDHVVIVVEENHSATNILGNPNAPYMNALANENANFTQSYALTHPSQPNYIAMFSGSTQGTTGDGCPHSFTAPTLADQLLAAGQTYASYSESLPSPGFTGCTSGRYVAKHSPWVNFPSVPASTNLPFTAFPSDYSTLPALSFVIPNLDNDMHDGTVAQGDAWLQTNLGGYVTWAQQHNSLFILTFDEDDNKNGNRIPTIMAGEQVTPGSYSETINHYTVLRTLQDAFGLAPLVNSSSATPILDIWDQGTTPAPSASFTSSCTGLSCTFDGSGSSDPDGTGLAYAWQFGDAQSGTGATPSHVYAAGGTFSVTLTVTNYLGVTGVTSKPVTVVAPTGALVASDTFARTVSNGWGTADLGGAWSRSGPASAFSVSPGAASMRLAVGSQLSETLASVSSSDTDLVVNCSADKKATGSGVYLVATGRRVGNNEYRARLRITPANTVTLSLSRLVGGTQTSITSERVVAGLTYTPGLSLSLRLQATGRSPTTLRAKVWATSGTEPGTWFATATDSTSQLQSAGGLGLAATLSSSATNAPVVARFSKLTAKRTTG